VIKLPESGLGLQRLCEKLLLTRPHDGSSLLVLQLKYQTRGRLPREDSGATPFEQVQGQPKRFSKARSSRSCYGPIKPLNKRHFSRGIEKCEMGMEPVMILLETIDFPR
jgi:hypothetical protein